MQVGAKGEREGKRAHVTRHVNLLPDTSSSDLLGGRPCVPYWQFHLYLTIYNYNSKGRREKQSAPQTSNIVTLFFGAFVLCQFVVKFEDPVKGHAAQCASTTLRLLH